MMYKIFFFAFFTSVFLMCSNNVSGTNDETVIRANATIYASDGRTPCAGAIVKAFVVNSSDGQYVYKQTTGTNGEYVLQGLPKGVYSIWAEKDSFVSFQDSVFLAAGLSTLKNDTLKCPSSLTGTVVVQPQDDPRAVTVQVLGSDKFFNNTDSAGTFSLKGLAAGKYTLLFNCTQKDYTPTTKDIIVKTCSKDFLIDTVFLIYTGIPVVTRLTAVYDTLSGIAKITWSRPSFFNLMEYLVFRRSNEQIDFPDTAYRRVRDTMLCDTIYHDLESDTAVHSYAYQVRVRTNTNLVGLPYGYVSLDMVPPSSIRTLFNYTTIHLRTGTFTDSATQGDSMGIILTLTNRYHRNTKVRWYFPRNNMILEKNLDAHALSGNDTVRIKFDETGDQTVLTEATDDGGNRWLDSVTLHIISPCPLLHAGNDTTVVIGDTLRLRPEWSDRFKNITSWEWNIGNAGFYSVSKPDTTIMLPDSAIGRFVCILKALLQNGRNVFDTLVISSSIEWVKVTGAGVPTNENMACPVFTFKDKLYQITYQSSNGMPAPSGRNIVYCSDDGINWQKICDSTEFCTRSETQTTVFNQEIFLAGGYLVDSDSSDSNCFSLAGNGSPYVNLLNDCWHSADGIHWDSCGTALPFSARIGHGLTQFNNKLLLIGGTRNFSHTPELNDVWQSTDGVAWQQISTLDYPRGNFSLVSFHDNLWIIGGYSIDGECVHTILTKDGAKWVQPVPSSCVLNYRIPFGAELFKNAIWTFRSEVKIGTVEAMLYYSNDGTTWNQGARDKDKWGTLINFKGKLWLASANGLYCSK